jgi:hypothetical protein
MERSLNIVFLINLFKYTNITHIFYKLNQTYGTKMERVHVRSRQQASIGGSRDGPA